MDDDDVLICSSSSCVFPINPLEISICISGSRKPDCAEELACVRRRYRDLTIYCTFSIITGSDYKNNVLTVSTKTQILSQGFPSLKATIATIGKDFIYN